MMVFYINKASGVVQSFPVPVGADWEKITESQPTPTHVYKEVGGLWQWVEPEDTREFKHFTGQDKLGIFTQEEQKAIYRAAYRDYDEDVMLVVKGLDNALYLTYSDPRTVAGLELLEAKELITPERRQEIIAVMTAEKQP